MFNLVFDIQQVLQESIKEFKSCALLKNMQMTFVAKQAKHSSPDISQEETLSWKEEFVCVGFVWFFGFFLQSVFPVALNVKALTAGMNTLE